jgi:hypothetical protein
MERLEVHGDDFVVVLAQKDAPESDVDLIQPAASVALYPNHAPRGKGSE